MSKLSLFLIAILASSCVTFTKQQCLEMDWAKEGERFGRAGRNADSVRSFEGKCAKHAVAVNVEEYEKGRAKGLQSYCTKENGYKLGLDGDDFNSVCSGSAGTEFMAGYTLGQVIYEKQKQQRELLKIKKDQNNLSGEVSKLRIQNHILKYGNNKRCTFDSDCTLEDDCQNDRCAVSQRACTFDSDCDIEGDCPLREKKCDYSEN